MKEYQKTASKVKSDKKPFLMLLGALAFLIYWYKTQSKAIAPFMPDIFTASDGPEVHNHQKMMNILRKDPASFRFNWANWTSMEPAPEYSKITGKKRYPTLGKYKAFSEVPLPTDDPKFTEEEWQIVLTKWFEERMEAPAQIVQLNSGGKPEIFAVQHEDPKRNNMFYDPENSAGIPCPGGLDFKKNYIRKVGPEQFEWNLENERVTGTAHDRKYIEVQGACGDQCPKYFYEHAPFSGMGKNGQHYDWKFYKKDAVVYERMLTLQSLARAWASFAHQFGIDFWFSHGAALAWSWNGMAFPWDTDLDVELPIQSFKKLAFNFSNTLIIPDPSVSKRAYYLELNPSFLVKERGNFHNLIDGRFIDIHTGSYIDLASLRWFDEEIIRCKNGHHYRHKEIGTLRYTKFEGVECYEPTGVLDILDREFGDGVHSLEYENWLYNEKMRLWTFKGRCGDLNYDSNCLLLNKMPYNKKLDTFNADEVWEYKLTKDYTAHHEKYKDGWTKSYVGLDYEKPPKGVFKKIAPKHMFTGRVVQ